MPDLRHHRDRLGARSSRRACVLALVVSMTAAVITGAVSSSAPSRAAVRGTTAAEARPLPVPTAGGKATAVPATDARLGHDVGADRAPVPAAPRGMSMDAPIQGGLTAHQEQALSARLVSAHRATRDASVGESWTAAAGRSAVARAESWLGMPYSWAGGTSAGPSAGRCEPGTGGDLDCHVVGFDCSGLAMYAWGAYLALPHLASAQRTTAGSFHPTLAQLLPGDLVFFSAYLPGGTGHVAVYAGHGLVIEAPQSGSVVRRATLADLVAHDGEYRGAVRPMTAATPTLTAPRSPLSVTGGTVTLRGTHLAGVDAVRIGSVTVRTFSRHSDSAITLRIPAHGAAAVALTVSTSWGAASKAVVLTFARPRVAPPSKPAPTKPAPAPPVSTPAPPVSTPAPPVSTPAPPVSTPAPTPPPSSPAPPRTTSTPAPTPAPTSGTSSAPVPSASEALQPTG